MSKIYNPYLNKNIHYTSDENCGKNRETLKRYGTDAETFCDVLPLNKIKIYMVPVYGHILYLENSV